MVSIIDCRPECVAVLNCVHVAQDQNDMSRSSIKYGTDLSTVPATKDFSVTICWLQNAMFFLLNQHSQCAYIGTLRVFSQYSRHILLQF